GSQSMLVLSDTTNHPWLFLRNPEWQASFDMDGAMAVDTRRRLLDRAAADKMLVQGYHFPFPASGHVTKSRDHHDLVPVMWQPAIERMIPKKPAPHLMRGGNRFSEKIMRQQKT